MFYKLIKRINIWENVMCFVSLSSTFCDSILKTKRNRKEKKQRKRRKEKENDFHFSNIWNMIAYLLTPHKHVLEKNIEFKCKLCNILHVFLINFYLYTDIWYVLYMPVLRALKYCWEKCLDVFRLWCRSYIFG